MAGETVITIIGNLTNDPELRWTQSGAPVADFTVASTPRSFDRQSGEWKDGETLFMRCSVWREMECASLSPVASCSALSKPARANAVLSSNFRSKKSAPHCVAQRHRSPARAARPRQAHHREATPRVAATDSSRATETKVVTRRARPATAHLPAVPKTIRGAHPIPVLRPLSPRIRPSK